MTRLKMFWWNELPNFGDALNPILVKRFFNTDVEWAPLREAALVGAGSCLQWVASEVTVNPHEMHVWGTGYMYDKESPVASELVRHHAVRGKDSARLGKLDSVALGDPGILCPLLFDKPISKKYRVGIVPHLWNQDDVELPDITSRYSDVKIINVRHDPLEIVEQIASCDFIFASSLHGLIVADSFNIPNQWVGFNKKLFGGGWKFADYYSVYDIALPRMLQFTMNLVEQDKVDQLTGSFKPRAGIKEMQRSLIQSFPKNID